MEFNEKTIASKEIYKGRIIDVKVDEVLLPNGEISSRELVNHKPGVAVLPIKKGNVIFVRQFRKAIERIILEIPAGLVEEGEDPAEAAIRELQEEIKLKPLDLTLLGDMLPSPGFTNEVTTLFMASYYKPEPKEQDDDEFIEIVEIPLNTVRMLYLKGMFTDAKTACALGRFFSLL